MPQGNVEASAKQSERILRLDTLWASAIRLTQGCERKAIGNSSVSECNIANLSIWFSELPEDTLGVDIWATASGKRRKVLNLQWKVDCPMSVISFHRGDWEREVLDHAAHVGQQAA